MPGPPPPPPPGGPPPMMPPPPVAFKAGGADNRGALLSSIRNGTKLKKTVTNDKSAPAIGGKVSNSNNNANNSSPTGKINGPASPVVPNGLGGLFAGGMPKLKPTGKLGAQTNTSQSSLNSSNSRAPDSPSSKSYSSIQSELKRQMANDNFSSKRGPPPPTPTRSYNNLSEETTRLQLTPKSDSSNGFHSNATTPSQIGLHRKTQSNVNISTLDTTDSSYNNNPANRPNHGKPHLAPKPPILNGKPAAPPKKLLINGKPVGRAQSMRSPRSPSPQSPDNNNPDYNKFATARNFTQVLNQSLGNLSQVKSRPLLNGRPSAPPPSIPNTPPPPPPSKMVKPPSQAPPPPPSHAPPPPPHRTGPLVPSRAPPSVPGANAPPPPPRHSSIRDLSNSKRNSSCDLESRFTFKKVTEFPRPPAFRNVSKVYTSRQVGNKQQAPLPPSQVQLSNRLWESSTC